MIAVRADPGQAWRTEPYERKLQYALRHGASLPPRASEAKVDTALERIFTGTSTRTAATLPAPASPQDQG